MWPVHGGAGSRLLLVVRPTEEMCGEEAAPPTVRRREVSGEEDATGGEMFLAEGVKRRGCRMVGARRGAPP